MPETTLCEANLEITHDELHPEKKNKRNARTVPSLLDELDFAMMYLACTLQAKSTLFGLKSIIRESWGPKVWIFEG